MLEALDIVLLAWGCNQSQVSAKTFALASSADVRFLKTNAHSPSFRTESYDDMRPVGQDDRWEQFQTFHDYLLTAYPRVCVFASSVLITMLTP